MFQAIAVHHARGEHVEDFLAFMHRVRAAVGEPPGLIEFTLWRDTKGSRLFGLSRWESEDAFRAAFPLIMSLAPERREEWSERPDDLLLLEDVA
jgi:heme-degrading monooxygenase HmoA